MKKIKLILFLAFVTVTVSGFAQKTTSQKKDVRQTQGFNMPWEEEYGYAQAVKKGNTVWISGQLGHDEKGVLAAGMEEQIKLTYRNAKKLLEGFGMGLENVVEEVVYVTDMKTGFAARKVFARQFYPNYKEVASTIVGVTALALPSQLIEIKFIAVK